MCATFWEGTQGGWVEVGHTWTYNGSDIMALKFLGYTDREDATQTTKWAVPNLSCHSGEEVALI
jgi:hypothetical protein